MQQNKLVGLCIPKAEIFIYLFTAKLHDVTITSLLCLCIICYKIDIPAGWLIRERGHFCRNIMSHMGKTNMIFVDPGAKVNSSYYCQFILGKGLLPDTQARCRKHKWTYQQDGVLAHTARNTTDYLKKEKIDFIEPDMWPQTALILILLTMLFGGPFSRVYHGRKFNSGKTKATDNHWVEKLSQRFIDNSINNWRRRLE